MLFHRDEVVLLNNEIKPWENIKNESLYEITPNSRLFYFDFDPGEDGNMVFNIGHTFTEGGTFILWSWAPQIEEQTKSVTSMLIWVNINNLP